MKIAIIAAVADNRVIGADGRIPWHISADLKRFKQLTLGHTVIMGRKTYSSIGNPLPGRQNIVLTRNPNFAAPGAVTVCRDLDTALRLATGNTVFIIGGADLYRQSVKLADTLHLTRVHQSPTGDTLFPPLDLTGWTETFREPHEGFTFLDYRRRQPVGSSLEQVQ